MPVSPADSVLIRAGAYVGNAEVPPGSNRGAFVVACQKFTWLAPGPWPWCVAFVQRVFAECGFPFPWKTAGAWDLLDRARKQGPEWTVGVPKPGAVAILRTGAGHACIVKSVDLRAGIVHTIDGNWGDKVCETTHAIADCKGFVWHPALAKKSVVQPTPAPAKAPLWEVVTSASGHKVVVFRAPRSRLMQWLGKQSSWQKRFPGGFTIRRAK